MPAAKSGGSGGKSTAKSEAVQAAQVVAKAAARPVPAQAKKAEAAEVKKQVSQTAAKNKAQESRDASRSAGRNSPIPKKNPSPSPNPNPNPNPSPNPEKTPVNTGGGPVNTGVSVITEEIFDNSNPIMEPIPEPIMTIMPVPDVIVKTPTRNVTDISSLVPQYDANYITKILFENLSAVELSIVERHDTIEGINQKYSIISNLSEIRKKYEIVKQLSIMDKFKPLTSIYTINIQDKIPQEDYLSLEDLNTTYKYLDENNQIVTRQKGYWYVDTNGDLVIELINLEKNQQVEVLIDTNGTIYKVES